jgi:DNA end-binding protein Ku
VAVAKVTIRTKERLSTLRTYDDTLVLETMYWPDEIRSLKDLDLPGGKTASPAPKEVEMARTLVESLASHFDPRNYKDEFRTTLLELIERRMKSDQRSAKRRKPEGKVVDLMEALQASLEASRAGGSSRRTTSSRGKPSTTRKSSRTPRRKAA